LLELKRKHISSKQTTINELRSEAQSKSQQHQWKIKELNEEIVKLSGKLKERHTEISKLTKDNENLKQLLEVKMVDELENKKQFARIVEEQEIHNSKLKIGLGRLKAKNYIFINEISSLKDENVNLTSLLRQETEKYSNVKKNVEVKCSSLKEQVKKVAQLQFKIKSFVAELDAKSKVITDQADKIDLLQGDIQVKSKLLQKFGKEIEYHTEENKRKTQLLSEFEKDVQAKTKILQENTVVITTKSIHNLHLQEKVDSLTQKLKRTTESKEYIGRTLQSEKKTIIQKTEKNNKLKGLDKKKRKRQIQSKIS